jgi:hypothetical protein
MKNISKIAEQTIAEKDTQAAKDMIDDIFACHQHIGKILKDIKKNLTNFNSPGFADSFVKSITENLNVRNFDALAAKNRIEKWIKHF